MVKKISIGRGLFALVDDRDFPLVSRFKWCAHKGKHHDSYYAQTTLRMHAFILGVDHRNKAFLTDHKNGNGLDNRRKNIRKATHTQNAQNRKQLSSNTSGFKGVDWTPHMHKWRARITNKGKRTTLGFFVNKKDAAKARIRAEKKYFKDFRRACAN